MMSQALPWLSLLLCVQGSPRPPLASSDLLGGVTEFNKAIIFVVVVYYSERIQIKVNSGRRCLVWEIPGTSFRVSFPVGVVWVMLNSPSSDVKRHAQDAATGGLARSDVQDFYWGSVTEVWNMTDLSYSA